MQLLQEESASNKLPDMSRLYTNEMALIHVCFEMENAGLKIDRNFVEDGLRFENEEITQAKKDFETDTGRAFTDSRKLFAEIFSSRGEKFPLTDKGNASFSKDVLEDIDTPTAKLINKIRYHEKRANTYWTSFLYFSSHDNILYPHLNQAATVTGRFSSSNPNLQNVPSEDEEDDKDKKYLIRRSFVPRHGNTFFSLDYDQMEYRLMLDYTGERGLIDAVNAGEDVHSATARLLGISRFHAKTVNFATIYGAGADKLAKMLGVPVSDAREIRRLYFAKLPMVKAHLYNIARVGETRGYIYNWMNRMYWCGNFEYSYKLPNWLIQGSGADAIKKAMVEIHEQIPEHGMRLQIHDELIFELPENKFNIVPKIKNIMESVYTPRNGMGLTTSVKYSNKSLAKWDFEKYVS